MELETGVSLGTFSLHKFHFIATSRYDAARKVKNAQDAYCAEAQAGRWHKLGIFPEDLQWESLVDILRGKVKARALLLLKMIKTVIICLSGPNSLLRSYRHR